MFPVMDVFLSYRVLAPNFKLLFFVLNWYDSFLLKVEEITRSRA